MRKIYLFILFIFLFSLPLPAALLFNLGIEEGAFYMSENVYFINNIVSDLAYIQPLGPKISLIGYYQMKYSGPGIGDSAETKFSERSQDHYFMLKPIIKLDKNFVVKPVLSFFKEFFKFGKNEEWGEGLYDYNKYEAGAEVVWLSPGFPVSVTGRYQSFKYPNYSDLLTLYLTGFSKEEPQEDYNNIMLGAHAGEIVVGKSFLIAGGYDINLSSYVQKKVLQADGYSGSANQKITSHLISILPQFKTGIFLFGLGFSYDLNDSNQNYIFGYDPTHITWLENYYSYATINLKPSVTLLFGKEHYLSFVFSYFSKNYESRPAQDTAGNYLAETMNIRSLSAGLAYRVKLSKYFSMTPSYMLAHSTSNNKYQQAVSYNYDAHVLTLGLNYQY